MTEQNWDTKYEKLKPIIDWAIKNNISEDIIPRSVEPIGSSHRNKYGVQANK